ncbi:hypothetical protein INR49_024918 [Caranx melampygus]|nr:hypothetical protein INR49_024918 [Caranx melampygus]
MWIVRLYAEERGRKLATASGRPVALSKSACPASFRPVIPKTTGSCITRQLLVEQRFLILMCLSADSTVCAVLLIFMTLELILASVLSCLVEL